MKTLEDLEKLVDNINNLNAPDRLQVLIDSIYLCLETFMISIEKLEDRVKKLEEKSKD